MQKNLNAKYSKLAVSINSKGRLFSEKQSYLRSPFQRDRDRIVHSTAFRRLKHKTQVFVNTTDDHYRTRITHSLEVSQIARTLAKFFNLNEDLCESLSLAHDLGHTPFGHAGEEMLNDCMIKHGGFDHNIQTLRVVTQLEKKYYDFDGLNLSIETLDGLIKHNGPIINTYKIDKILGKNFFREKINFKQSPSLEAQIASISDDIAYNSHDIEDGLNAKLFYIDDLKGVEVISEIIKKNKKNYNKFDKELFTRQLIRNLINEMVKDLIQNTSANIKKKKIRNIRDVYNSTDVIVTFSNKMKKFDRKIKYFLREKMYYSPSVKLKTNQGKQIIKFLFNKISSNPYKFITKKKNDKDLSRSICDFVAGMTDRYAINLYNKLK